MESVTSWTIGIRSDHIDDWLLASRDHRNGGIAKTLDSARVGARDLNLSRRVLRHSDPTSVDL